MGRKNKQRDFFALHPFCEANFLSTRASRQIGEAFKDWKERGQMTFNFFPVMQSVMFNSVPLDMVLPIEGLNKREDRLKMLFKYLRKYGMPEEYIFSEEDLFEFKNIPKVTRCVAMLAKMVGARKSKCTQCILDFLGLCVPFRKEILLCGVWGGCDNLIRSAIYPDPTFLFGCLLGLFTCTHIFRPSSKKLS